MSKRSTRVAGVRRFGVAAGLAGLLTAGIAGAATVHRLASQSGGSEGSTAFVQTSATGSALQGEVSASANTSIKIPFGVLGEYDAAGGKFGIGIAGISTTGYGVGAETFSSNPTMIALNESTGDGLQSYSASGGGGRAMYAEAQGSGDGIDAQADGLGDGAQISSRSGNGIVATSHASGTTAAVFGISSGAAGSSSFDGIQEGAGYAGLFQNFGSGDAVFAQSSNTSGAAVVGLALDGSDGVLGDYSGEAIAGFGHSGNASHPAIVAIDAVGGTRLLQTDAYDGGKLTPSFFVDSGTQNRSGEAPASFSTDVQISGDVYVYGTVFQNCEQFPASSSTDCSPISGGTETTGADVARTANGANVTMYGSRKSLPSVEDEGTAQLVAGRAIVRIDPAFAQTMNATRGYRVYVTPNGPSRGVYVVNRTPQTFEVDENPGRRSTISFDYRIVAAPFGDSSVRLAAVHAKTAHPAYAAQSAALRVQAFAKRPALSQFERRAMTNFNRPMRRGAPASFVSITK